MKILKTILKIIAVLVVVLLIASAFMPSSYKVERSITVNAPIEIVFAEANDFANMDHWSPWKDYDPAMKKNIEGIVGSPGYKLSWSSENENVGHGSLTRVTTETNKAITNDLAFEDFNMKSKDNWLFEQTQEGVKITWGNSGEIGYLWRIPMKMMNMEKMMAPDFEKGLSRIKEYCEAKINEAASMQPVAPADSADVK